MSVDIRTITASEFESLEFDDRDAELIRGEVIEMSPPAFEHGEIQIAFGSLLKVHVKAHKIGRVIGEAGFILEVNPDTVLAPDISYISEERLSKSTRARNKFQDIAPELVVEIVSPSDLAVHVNQKASIFIEAGVQLVVQIWPNDRQVTLISSDRGSTALRGDDVLDLNSVIPGFSCRVSEIFD